MPGLCRSAQLRACCAASWPATLGLLLPSSEHVTLMWLQATSVMLVLRLGNKQMVGDQAWQKQLAYESQMACGTAILQGKYKSPLGLLQ